MKAITVEAEGYTCTGGALVPLYVPRRGDGLAAREPRQCSRWPDGCAASATCEWYSIRYEGAKGVQQVPWRVTEARVQPAVEGRGRGNLRCCGCMGS